MDSVFISSVQTGFEGVRQAAKLGVEKMDMRPRMAEQAAASPQSPGRALLDRVAQADLFLLLLGQRYGMVGASGRSPTEDEFDEAVRLGKPIIVLRQEGALEPEQEAFLERVRGGWEKGRLYASFAQSADVTPEVMSALRGLEARGSLSLEDTRAASARATELAGDPYRGRAMHSGAPARVGLVPLGAPARA
jgi:hypothetical protein